MGVAPTFVGEGIAINSPIIDGMPTAQAKEEIIAEQTGLRRYIERRFLAGLRSAPH